MHDQAWLPVWTFAFWTKKSFFCTLWLNPFWSCILVYKGVFVWSWVQACCLSCISTWRFYKFDIHDQVWLPLWTFAFWTKKPFFCILWLNLLWSCISIYVCLLAVSFIWGSGSLAVLWFLLGGYAQFGSWKKMLF